MKICSFGAAEEVTGSCHLLSVGDYRILLDCGLLQGGRNTEMRNREPFAFDVASIDAVILSHAHIDHSGRIPSLCKEGFKGPIYTHCASLDLCEILLRDSAYLNEKAAQWENRKREHKTKENISEGKNDQSKKTDDRVDQIEPLYTQQEAADSIKQFQAMEYNTPLQILPGVTVTLQDAGHILGSAIVELSLQEGSLTRKLVFSGDLGQAGMPILSDPTVVEQADLVLMESTYGDRLHRGDNDTQQEIIEVIEQARYGKGNILIPAFAVGRSQFILYWMAKNFEAAGLSNWQVFLDSPLAIKATEIYAKYSYLYDAEAAQLWQQQQQTPLLPNLHISRSAEESKAIHRIRSGAIIIAGSGMCTGGRIQHHLRDNLGRKGCHVVIVGYQAGGTLGRLLVDGASEVRIRGKTIRVEAKIHTVGGLSAHADQSGLINWYKNFQNLPQLLLVHGEQASLAALAEKLTIECAAPVQVMVAGQSIDFGQPQPT